MQAHAHHHALAIVMANHGGPTGGWQAAGQSALWDKQRHRVCSAAGIGNRLLILAKRGDAWHGEDVALQMPKEQLIDHLYRFATAGLRAISEDHREEK